MEWVVTTGRTVSEAVESALDKLGVDEQDAEIEVVQEPQKGCSGACVRRRRRARVRPTTPRPKVDRRDRRRAERRGRDGDRNRGKARSAGCGDGATATVVAVGSAWRPNRGDGDRASDGAVVMARADVAGDDGPGSVEGRWAASTGCAAAEVAGQQRERMR